MLTLIALIAFVATHFAPGELFFYLKIPIGIFLAFSAIHDAKERGFSLFGRAVRLKNFKKPEHLALYIAVFQITLLVVLGIFFGFGNSPYSLTPLGITTNVLYILSTVFGIELSRACITRILKRKMKENAVLVAATLYFLILLIPQLLLFPTKPIEQLKFLGSIVIPLYTQQFFASLLVYVHGAKSSISYILPITAFQWFSPILPNINWTLNALVTTALPAIGYSILEKERETKRVQVKRGGTASWMAFIIAVILTFLFFIGAFGVHPAIIGSGSMSPQIETGDIVIVLKTDPDNLNIGDVIQYMADGYTVTHRVVDIFETSDGRYFITKGDANKLPDDPVKEDRVIGKVIFVLPKVGLIPLYLKKLFELWGIIK